MKKILSLILAVVMLFGVMLISSSCDLLNESKINRALKKTNKLEYVNADVNMTIKASYGGNSNTQKIDYSMEVDASDEDNPVAVINMEGYKFYMDNDYIYIDDEEIKVPIEDFSGEGTLSGDDINDFFDELPDEVFEDADFEKGKKGKLTMKAELEDELFEDVFGELTESLTSSLASSDANLSYDDCELTIVVKDGYVIEYGLDFVIAMEMSGREVEVEVSFTITVNDPGEDGEVTLPSGCKNWDEESTIK